MLLPEFLNVCQARVEHALKHWLPTEDTIPQKLHQAMRYVSLDGGKRIRPVLVYATGRALGVEPKHLDGPACAMELIHTYSLVHDDLPAMDNDALRRGKPTCHIAFDEATAILVGDGLQALAFHILAHDPHMMPNPQVRLEMVNLLSQAAGSRGMVGGQAIDLDAVGKELTLAELENMHIHKTGALIRASVQLGALSAPLQDPEHLEKLDHYAKCIGLAFQIQDDILDVESDTETLGKTQGSDSMKNKPTYPAIVGMKQAKAMAADLHQQALASLEPLGDNADMLRAVANYIVEREN